MWCFKWGLPSVNHHSILTLTHFMLLWPAQQAAPRAALENQLRAPAPSAERPQLAICCCCDLELEHDLCKTCTCRLLTLAVDGAQLRPLLRATFAATTAHPAAHLQACVSMQGRGRWRLGQIRAEPLAASLLGARTCGCLKRCPGAEMLCLLQAKTFGLSSGERSLGVWAGCAVSLSERCLSQVQSAHACKTGGLGHANLKDCEDAVAEHIFACLLQAYIQGLPTLWMFVGVCGSMSGLVPMWKKPRSASRPRSCASWSVVRKPIRDQSPEKPASIAARITSTTAPCNQVRYREVLVSGVRASSDRAGAASASLFAEHATCEQEKQVSQSVYCWVQEKATQPATLTSRALGRGELLRSHVF